MCKNDLEKVELKVKVTGLKFKVKNKNCSISLKFCTSIDLDPLSTCMNFEANRSKVKVTKEGQSSNFYNGEIPLNDGVGLSLEGLTRRRAYSRGAYEERA